MTELGRLERVELRAAWEREDADFTPWLAREENLALLAETLGVDLELVGEEQRVGPFRADILCSVADSDHLVLVENQLERTDHTHLGQLMTYAAGLETATIVWIAARVTDEHRAAIDWLNRITSDEFRFFALEVELWRIGDSPMAPKFNIVAKPNEWSKSAGQASRAMVEASPLNQLYLRYWSALSEMMEGGPVKLQGPQPRNWISSPVGRSYFSVNAVASVRRAFVRAELYIASGAAKAWFDLLERDRDAIEAEFGEPLDWQRLPEGTDCRICVALTDIDIADESDWPRQHAWVRDRLERLHRVFAPRVRALPRDADPMARPERPGDAPGAPP